MKTGHIIVGSAFVAYSAYGLTTIPDAGTDQASISARNNAQLILIGAAALGAFLLWKAFKN